MVAIDHEGGRKRCPRCLTRFALGSRINPGSAGPAEFLAFELFDDEGDDEIEVLDDEPAEAAAAPAKPIRTLIGPGHDHPIPDELPAKKKPRYGEDYEDLYDERDYQRADTGNYVYYPEDAPGWRLTKWGITLILLAIVLRFAAMAFAFFAFILAAAAPGESSLLPLSNLVGFAADALTLIGTCLCLNVPRQTGARSWVIMSLCLSVAALFPALFILPLALGMEMEFVVFLFHNPVVLIFIVGAGIMLAFGGFMCYLMFLERVAEVFNERGIEDSINGTIKLAGTLAASIVIAMIVLAILLTHDPAGKWANGADPSILVLGVCAGAFQAWIGILGLIVFIKYVFNLLNVRALIEWYGE